MYVINKTGNALQVRGRTIPANNSYEIPKLEQGLWGLDDTLISALSDASEFTMSLDGSTDYSLSPAKNIALIQGATPTIIESSPSFTTKKLADGQSIFQRVHGAKIDLDSSGSSQSITFTNPYTHAKITGVNVIGALSGDSLDFEVLDSSTGLLTNIPNYKLNQFGFGVYPAESYYEHKSTYDADLYDGLQIQITVLPKDSVQRSIYFNLILHEVKPA